MESSSNSSSSNSNKKFRTKRGLLTSYALACGYQQIADTVSDYLCLEKDSSCCYSVKHSNYPVNYLAGKMSTESFDNLAEARKYYQVLKKKLKAKGRP